jgi:plastocyanin
MAILANCEAPSRAKINGSGSARAREIVVTTVPLLTKELATTYPFLKKDFATGGVLAGKEVYEFMPSTITVVEGDTLRLTFINPEDDAHSFVMGGLSVAIPGQSETHATYVAAHAGIYDFVCAIPAHLPMMRGQLVVLRQEKSAH